jgi:hypothetical protein
VYGRSSHLPGKNPRCPPVPASCRNVFSLQSACRIQPPKQNSTVSGMTKTRSDSSLFKLSESDRWNSVQNSLWMCSQHSFYIFRPPLNKMQCFKRNATTQVRTNYTSIFITHMHEGNMRPILRAINKRATCELPAAYKQLRLIAFKRWGMPPVSV